jgi:hypothetical protein
MSVLRRVAILALVTAALLFTVRYLAQYQQTPEARLGASAVTVEEARLLSYHTDSIVAMDLSGRVGVALGFPSAQPVVAFLFRETCQACQRAKPMWEALAHELVGRARVIAATLDRDTSGARFLDAANVCHLWFETPRRLERAFGTWHVVPISLVIAPSGYVTWARLGPLDSMARVAVLEHVGNLTHPASRRGNDAWPYQATNAPCTAP